MSQGLGTAGLSHPVCGVLLQKPIGRVGNFLQIRTRIWCGRRLGEWGVFVFLPILIPHQRSPSHTSMPESVSPNFARPWGLVVMCWLDSHVRLFCDPMNCSPPGFAVRGILQARILRGLPCPPPGDLSNLGIKPESLASLALAGRFFTTSATLKAELLWKRLFFVNLGGWKLEPFWEQIRMELPLERVCGSAWTHRNTRKRREPVG